ncbi:oligosaccharide flippase family protein (plasmid) [Fusobacterium sp. SB021]|uniref:oligosaccharide flippase family protein n=1 Tax=Fusobacterium sp. SB021 TaxID=2744227 RepID=UPI003CF64401
MKQKSLRDNYILNILYQILAMIVPFITIPYVARVLKVEQMGIYNYVFSVANIFINFIVNGTEQYGLREIAYRPNEKKENTKLLIELTLGKLILFLILTIPYIIISFLYNYEYRYIYIIHIVLLFSYAIDISWFYKGQEEFKKIVTRNITIKLLSVICIFLFVKSSKDFYRYAILMVGSTLIGNITLFLGISVYTTKIKIKEIKISKIKEHINPCIIFFIPILASNIYAYLDKILLGIFSIEMEVAYYSQAEKIVKMVLGVITALEVVLLPRISYYVKNKEYKIMSTYLYKTLQFIFFIGIPLIFGMIFISPYFIPLFLGTEYNKCILNVKILSFLILIIGIASITGGSVMIPIGKQKKYNLIIIGGSILNGILNIFFIPYFKSYGASVATICAESFITISILISLKKYLNIFTILKENYQYLIASIFMFLILKSLSRVFYSDIESLFFIITIGGISYFSLLLLIKDSMTLDILSFIKTKIIKSI